MGFSLTAEQLSSMYEPKSLAKFGQLFDEEPAKLYEKLQTDKEQGISDGSRESERYKRYNDNRVPERPPKTFLALAWEAFNDKTMLLLTAAAVVSLALGLYEAFTQPPEYDPDGNKIPRVDWIEGVAIMLAVVVVVLVGTSNDYQKEKQFLKLNRKKEDRQVVVYRNGEEQLISVHDLLVGDLMHLQTGEVVPADCILVDGNCEADESTVTGETDAIKVAPLEQVWKRYVRAIRGGEGNGSSNNSIDPDAADCMLISGSKLISGLGKAVVTAVGVNSVHGKTMMSLKTEPEATPLQERLSELSDSISVFGCASAIILFVVLFIQFLLDIREGGKLADLPAAKRGSQFMSILITSITIIVVAVPEGLPLAVTLSLAFATTRMTKDGNLVRVLSACETMGSATAVCSDKTGTLTENRMTVVKGYLGSSEFDEVAENSGNTEVTMKSMLEGKISEDIKQDVLANIVLNSTAFENKKFQEQQQHHEEEQGQRLRGNTSDNPFSSILTRGKSRLENLLHSGDEDLATPQVKSVEEPYIGSKTETALLTMASKNFGLGNLKEWRQNHKDHFKIAKIVQVIPFESSRKWGGIVVKYEGEKKYRFFAKGAAEIIFSRTLYHRNSNGSLVKLDGQGRQIIDEHIQGLASDALRAISIAHKDLNYEGTWPPQNIRDDEENEALPDKLFGEVVNEKSQDGFVLDALVGIQDPLRPGVKNSIEQCQKAGVTIRMVTGDNITTARAIARNCSILSEEDWVDSDCAMEGPKFRELSNDERVKILPKLRVLARSSPEDKKILVGTLKQMGDVVASTGDGTNDAPALKMADVGFSMGIAGTEVAREASDIILMTDDFTAIVNAIKWGRCVSGSIKKFIQFQLTVNVTAVVLTFISSVTTGRSVLTAVQLLWVNLIMDTLAALALATDRPDANIMDRKPVGRQAPLISVSSWKMIMCQSILQLAVTLTLTYRSAQIFFGREVTNHEKEMLNACTFNTFVWLQFFTLFVSRKLDEADGVKSWRQRISRENLDFSQDLGRNGYFLGVMAVIGFFQVFIMKFGGVAFSIAEQTPSMWACAIISSLLSIPIGALVRICPDEVALAIYPKRFIGIVWYIGSLGFFKKNAKRGLHDDEESLLGEAQEESSISTRSDNYT